MIEKILCSLDAALSLQPYADWLAECTIDCRAAAINDDHHHLPLTHPSHFSPSSINQLQLIVLIAIVINTIQEWKQSVQATHLLTLLARALSYCCNGRSTNNHFSPLGFLSTSLPTHPLISRLCHDRSYRQSGRGHDVLDKASVAVQELNRPRTRTIEGCEDQDLSHLPLVARQTHREAENADLHTGHEQDRADGVGRLDPDQERSRPHIDLPAKLQRRYLW